MESTSRHAWMDLVRGAAVLLVITWHATTVPASLGLEIPEAAGVLGRAVSPFRLPALLVVSGMLLERSLGKPVPDYLGGKVRHILWPFLVWTPIMALLRDPASLADPVTWLAGRDHLWFLTTLLVCYLAALALRRVPAWTVALALWAVWFTVAPQVPGLANWIWFGGYFFAGAALGAEVERIDRLRWPVVTGLGVVAALGAAVAVLRSGYAWSPPWLVVSLAGVVVLVRVAPRWAGSRWTAPVEAVGRRSVVYYLAHVAALVVVARALVTSGLDVPWLAYALLVGAGIALPYVLTRVPGTGWLFSAPGGRTQASEAGGQGSPGAASRRDAGRGPAREAAS